MQIVLNMQLKSHRESELYKLPMDEIEQILDNNVAIMQLLVTSDVWYCHAIFSNFDSTFWSLIKCWLVRCTAVQNWIQDTIAKKMSKIFCGFFPPLFSVAKFCSVPTQEFPDRKLEYYKYGKTENKTSQVRKSQRFRNLIRKYYPFLIVF